MAYVCVEISCAAGGKEGNPVPTTLRIARVFASKQEAQQEFGEDQIFKADSEYMGQDIYYLLWKMDEKLNLDRSIDQDNTISNCGMWLPDSERIYADVTESALEIVPAQKIKERAREKEAAAATAKKQHKAKTKTGRTRIAYDKDEDDLDDDYYYNQGGGSSRLGSATSGVNNGRSRHIATWNKVW